MPAVIVETTNRRGKTRRARLVTFHSDICLSLRRDSERPDYYPGTADVTIEIPMRTRGSLG